MMFSVAFIFLSRLFAFLIPWNDISDYFHRRIRGACGYAHEHHPEINIIIKNGRAENSWLERIRDQQYFGVIVVRGDELRSVRTELEVTELPVVFLDTVWSDGTVGYSDSDSYAGSRTAVRHPLDHGHREIGYIHYNDNDLVVNRRQRFQGYVDVMTEAGLTVASHWTVRNSG